MMDEISRVCLLGDSRPFSGICVRLKFLPPMSDARPTDTADSGKEEVPAVYRL